jgi:hypothetical protein
MPRELVDLGVLIAAPIVAGWIFVRVAREEIATENTATDELRARTLDFYKQHLNDERASLTGLTRSESRIGRTGPTTNNTSSIRG